MLRILSEEERQRVREAFGQHPLYAACATVFPRRAAHLNGLDIMEEDIFCAAAELLDVLYNAKVPPSQPSIDKLWIEIYRDIRKPQPAASEDDKRQVAHTVFAIVRKVLCHHWETRLCETLFERLGHTIDKEVKAAEAEEMEQFMRQLIRETNSLQEWVNNVYDGALGKEIEEKLKTEDTPLDCNINVFNDRLNQQAIVKAIKELNRGNMGEVNFAYAVHTFFESVKWLSFNIDTRFVLWMKANGLMKVRAKDLKQAKAQDSRVISLMNDMRSVFQEKHPRTDNWRDKKEYYNPNRKLINTGD